MSRIAQCTLGALVSLLSLSPMQAQQASVSSEAAGSVPRLIRFGGTLPGRQGASLAAAAARVTFAIYEERSGGAALWSEVQDVRLDAQGRYSVLLGAASSDGLPAELFSTGGPRWLGVQVEGRQEDARVLLVAVPYALKAADSDTLGGKPATAFVATDQLKDQVQSVVNAQAAQSGTTTRTLVGTAPTPQALGETQSSFVCNLAADCVAVTQSGAGVGLHATTPTGTSVLGELSGTSGAAVFGRATAGTGAASAVQGDSASTGGVGVLGRAAAATGTNKGVFGRSFSTGGIGVHGDATTATGATRGVWGTTASNAGVGVYGQSASTTGFTTGVTGTVASTAGVGVLGQANAVTGSTIGVQAKVLSSAGTALVADNVFGGKIFSGQFNGVEKASISGTGVFTGNGSGLTNVNAVLLGNVAAANYPQLNVSNTGSLTLTGALTSKGLAVTPDVTDTSGGPTFISTNVIGGYTAGNSVTAGATGATIAGGGGTLNGGAVNNLVTDDWGTVGGGRLNRAGDNAGTFADHAFATVGGGRSNTASGDSSTVAGGLQNTASGLEATVAGGGNNMASGAASTVAGGYFNLASGAESFAAGCGANAAHTGAFVWADSACGAPFTSTANNQFLIRAAGGVGIGTNNPGGAMLAVAGNVTVSGGGVISGNGSGLTNLNATNLSTGTVPLADISGLTNLNISNSAGIAATKISGTAATLAATTNVFNGNIQVGFALVVDQASVNEGITINPGLTFGNSSGEGIASNRTNATTNNQFGLDFYTNSARRLSITNAGNVGINTTIPAATLDVAGTVRVGNATTKGTVLTAIQAGTATVGPSGSAAATATVTFPSAFTSVPHVIATARGENFGDTFVVSTRSITTTQFVVNIVRVDTSTGWAQTLQLDWFAWQ